MNRFKAISISLNPDKINFRRFVFIVGLMLYSIILYNLQQFDDSSNCWGDERDYQSTAVNFSKGYGLQIFGVLGNWDDYKFLYGDNNEVGGFVSSHYYNFYRTPMYPLFVGSIYFFTGVHPYIVKLVQLFLIVLVGVYLPLLGYQFWQKKGFYVGLLASPFFIFSNYLYAAVILTEAFVVFIIFLMVVSWLYHKKHQSYFSFALLGFVLGISWLSKGILMPITLFVFIYEGLGFLKNKNKQLFTKLCLMVGVFILPILPYSIYVNLHAKEYYATFDGIVGKPYPSADYTKKPSFIFISTQGKTMLLDAHNEYVYYGFWNPQWKNEPRSFYNNDKMSDKSAAIRIFNFYSSHPKLIFKLLKEKILSGFFTMYFFCFVILIFIFDSVRMLFLSFFEKRKLIYSIFLVSTVLLIISGMLLYVTTFSGPVYFMRQSFFQHYVLMGNIMIGTLLFMLIAAILNRKKEKLIHPPFIISATFLSFVFMIAITCDPGVEFRFVKLLDFIFILFSFYYFFVYLELALKICKSLSFKKQEG